MAMVHGKGGSVIWGGAANTISTHILSWSVDATADTAESTAMGDTWKSYLGGFLDWTATVETNWDSATSIALLTPDLGVTIIGLELEIVDTGASLTGNALLTGVSAATDKDDVVKVSYNFQGSGALAYTA